MLDQTQLQCRTVDKEFGRTTIIGASARLPILFYLSCARTPRRSRKQHRTNIRFVRTCKSIVARIPSVLACCKNAGMDFARSMIALLLLLRSTAKSCATWRAECLYQGSTTGELNHPSSAHHVWLGCSFFIITVFQERRSRTIDSHNK